MTSKEILKADIIDIIFENRNKNYGAYALRKNYNRNMSMALGIALGSVVLITLLVQPGASNNNAASNVIEDVVKLTDFKVDPIKPPEPVPTPPQQPLAQIRQTDQIIIGQHETDVASIDDMVNRQISTQTIDGLETPDIIPTSGPAPVTTANGPVGQPDVTPPFDPIEVQPSFPGGSEAWINFLQRHLRVPDELEPGQKVTVLIKFWVGTDGSINNFEVVKSGGESFDREVIRVLKKMPKWKPAIQNGHPAATSFTQPVSFMVHEQ